MLIFLLVAAATAFLFWFASNHRQAVPADEADTDTEFTAEVVRVVNVRPHPNADRLEIADFELLRSGVTDYEVVVGRGDFKAGDLARYFSVDCLLPLERPEFAFLASKDHPDRTHHRLRAARLRGVYSQGLLVPPQPGDELGARVAQSCGVSYYRPEAAWDPDHYGADKAPPKPPFAPHYGVDSLKKLPGMFGPGDVVQVTEKVHGCNVRFGWVKSGFLGRYKFRVGSHKSDVDPAGDSPFAIAARELGLADKTAGAKGTVFYGEFYGLWHTGAHIQDLTYGASAAGADLVVFDARDMENRRWLSVDERAELLDRLRLPSPPELGRFAYGDGALVRGLAEGPSCLWTTQTREGCVVEAVDGARRKAKYVGEGYLTRETAPKRAKRPVAA